jgi:hypothetical protein
MEEGDFVAQQRRGCILKCTMSDEAVAVLISCDLRLGCQPVKIPAHCSVHEMPDSIPTNERDSCEDAGHHARFLPEDDSIVCVQSR